MISRGEVIVDGGKLTAKPGHGQYIKRAAFNERLSPQGAA